MPDIDAAVIPEDVLEKCARAGVADDVVDGGVGDGRGNAG